MDKFIVSNTACDLCVKEYVEKESTKLADNPLDQRKSSAIHRILLSANRACTKVVVKLPCEFGKLQHYICEKHLYAMIDAIKEHEDNSKDD